MFFRPLPLMSALLQEVLFDGAEYWYTLFYAERTAAAHSDCDRRIRGRAQFRSQGREGFSRRARGSPRYGPVRGGDAPDVPPDARRLPVDDLPHAPPLEMDVRGERQAQYGGEARQGNCPRGTPAGTFAAGMEAGCRGLHLHGISLHAGFPGLPHGQGGSLPDRRDGFLRHQ